MAARNAASVLPEPVGAATRVLRPATIEGQARSWGSVGVPNRERNQAATAGWKRLSGITVPDREGETRGPCRAPPSSLTPPSLRRIPATATNFAPPRGEAPQAAPEPPGETAFACVAKPPARVGKGTPLPSGRGRSRAAGAAGTG